MRFIIYSPSADAILQWGTSEEGHAIALSGDEVLVSGDFSDLTHYVLKGKFLAYTPAQVAARATCPNLFSTWSNASMRWVDRRSVADRRVERVRAIKQFRDARKLGGYFADGRWFQSDPVSFAQYGIMLTTALEKSLPLSYTLHAGWRDLSGFRGPLTVAVLREIRDSGLEQEKALFDAAEAHIAKMNASVDPTSYTWVTGWPATYGESA